MRVPPAPLPSPAALRLVCRGTSPTIKPPCGLASFCVDEAAATLVVLSAAVGEPTPGEILTLLPKLTRGCLIIIAGEILPGGLALTRFLAPKRRVGRAPRAAALLAGGYVQLGAGVDPKTSSDLVWGYAP